MPERVDRFMFKVILDYPSIEEERRILDRMAFTSAETEVKAVVTLDQILATRNSGPIHVDDKIAIHRRWFCDTQTGRHKLD